MNPTIKSKNILYSSYIVAFLIACILDSSFRLIIFLGSIFVTSLLFFWQNRYLPKKDIIYYYLPFLGIWTVTLSLSILFLSHSTSFLEMATYIFILFVMSIVSFYLVTHFSLLRKNLFYTAVFSFLLFIFTNAFVYVVYQYYAAQNCNKPNVFCYAPDYLFPIKEKDCTKVFCPDIEVVDLTK